MLCYSLEHTREVTVLAAHAYTEEEREETWSYETGK